MLMQHMKHSSIHTTALLTSWHDAFIVPICFTCKKDAISNNVSKPHRIRAGML
jgi:hypothetical protein